MDSSGKSQPDNYEIYHHDAQQPTGKDQAWAQQSIRFEGQGISNHHGNVHIGRDFVVHNLAPGTAEDSHRKRTERRRQQLLYSLRFDHMDARQMGIRRPHKDTCSWFLKTYEYRAWRELRQNFLWIKGNPGTGKSTLMKFILSHANQSMPEKILSFFFHARGNDLEKSTNGLYRSLLTQLFSFNPEALCVLDGVPDGYQWDIEGLESCFESAIQFFRDTPIVCFIDALDECDEMQTRQMVLHLSDIAQDSRLSICFASRHYPNITVKNALSLTLETHMDHDEDIAKYINSRLDIGCGPQSRQVRSILQRKASGIFIWVVLVIGILNKENDHGGAHNLLKRLRELPSDLDTLFRDILTRPDNNSDRFRLCIQWILFAREPLAPKELYFAILCGAEPHQLTNYRPGSISTDDLTEGTVRKYILNTSRGLVHSTKYSPSGTELVGESVEFIHESVRTFFLDRSWFNHLGGGNGDVYGISHDTLKQCCLEYMSIALVDHPYPPDPLPKYRQSRILAQNVAKRLPFIEYAVHNVLYHADQAESSGISQERFMQSFSITHWRKYSNLFRIKLTRNYIRPYTRLPYFSTARYSPTVSLLYILAENNLPFLIRAHLCQTCFVMENEHYGAPILAALAKGNTEAVQALLEVLAKNQPRESTMHELCKRWKDVEIASDYEFALSAQRGILSLLAEYGQDIILSCYILVERGNIDINARDEDGRTPLSWAAGKTGNEVIVRMLLEQGAQVETVDERGRTPLSWAAESGDQDIVQILLEQGAQTDAADESGRTPLSWAAESGNDRTIKILLGRGAQVETADESGRTSLSWAAESGNETAVKILLEQGAQTEAADKSGRTSLSWAAEQYSNEITVWVLLAYGAYINASDNSGRTPLLYSLEACSMSTAEFLRSRGASETTKSFIHFVATNDYDIKSDSEIGRISRVMTRPIPSDIFATSAPQGLVEIQGPGEGIVDGLRNLKRIDKEVERMLDGLEEKRLRNLSNLQATDTETSDSGDEADTDSSDPGDEYEDMAEAGGQQEGVVLWDARTSSSDSDST